MRARPLLFVLAVLPAFLLGLPAASACEADVSRWMDRGRLFEIARCPGDGWRAARVRDVQGDAAFSAHVGRDAIVQTDAPSTLARSRQLEVVRTLSPRRGLYLVRSLDPLEDGAHLAQRLGHAGVIAVPDLALAMRAAEIDVPPDDPRYGGQWYLARLDIERAWARSTGAPDVTIAIVDNGCDLAHADLAPQLLPGRDVLDGDDDPSFLPGEPGNEHGTACAGIAAARGDDGIGIAGTCPECSLRCVRLLGAQGALIPVSANVEAFELAIARGDSVISNSWGFVTPIPVPGPLATILEAAFEEGRGGLGALVVFAAGNEDRELGDDELTGVRGVVTVGAVRSRDEATSFTNRGRSIDVSAPTGTVTTDIRGAEGNDPGDYTALFGGTSSSAPVVAGVAGLLFAAVPDATAQEVHDALITTARRAIYATPGPDGHDPVYGYGIVDPAAALDALLATRETDAGIEELDAGTEELDAGTPPVSSTAGCGCSVVASARGAGWGIALVLVLFLARRRRALWLTLALLVPTVPARAQPGCADDDDLCARDVVVTATRTEGLADESPVRVEVIDREQIEQSGARDLGEILEEQPGVIVSRTFRGDEIQMQGLDPEYVLVLVDGDRVPGRIGGAIDLGRYSVEDIERIEIVRGASSAMYGSDAIAGVINIITRRAREELEADASAMAGGGSGAVMDATARVGGRIGDVSMRLSGGFHFADAFRRGASDGVPEGEQATAGSGRMQWSLGGDARWRVDRTLSLDARADYMQRQLSGVDRSAGGAVFDRLQLAEQLQAALSARWDTGGGTRITLRGTYSLFREQYLYDQRGSDALDDDQDNREDLGQLTFQVDQVEGDHLLTAGFEELFQRLESARLEHPGGRFRFAPFLQDSWFLIDRDDMRLVVVPGVRLDADSQFGMQLSPKLSVRFDPIPELVFRASYGSGFRAPSFQELLLRFENPSVGYVVEGNPELGAESSRSLQVSAEWRAMRELRISANFFRNDIDGLITTVTVEESSAGSLFSYANISSAYTQGLEASLLARPIRELSLRASYTLTDSWDEEHQRALEGRAMHRITASATFEHAAWELGATARCALTGERPFYVDDDGDGIETTTQAPWAAQLDVRVWKRITRHFEMSVGIDNVLDAGDAYLSLRPRTFYGGLRGRY